MRVNVYAEEMTDRIEIIGKEIEGQTFTGLRFYLELPATVAGRQYQAPFMHHPGDDDSAAVTFWGKRDLRAMLRIALDALDKHYGSAPPVDDRILTQATDVEAMVSKFLAWHLPASVCADEIATMRGRSGPQRTGTNLLTATEAKAMFEHCVPARSGAAVVPSEDAVREAILTHLDVGEHVSQLDKAVAAVLAEFRGLNTARSGAAAVMPERMALAEALHDSAYASGYERERWLSDAMRSCYLREADAAIDLFRCLNSGAASAKDGAS